MIKRRTTFVILITLFCCASFATPAIAAYVYDTADGNATLGRYCDNCDNTVWDWTASIVSDDRSAPYYQTIAQEFPEMISTYSDPDPEITRIDLFWDGCKSGSGPLTVTATLVDSTQYAGVEKNGNAAPTFHNYYTDTDSSVTNCSGANYVTFDFTTTTQDRASTTAVIFNYGFAAGAPPDMPYWAIVDDGSFPTNAWGGPYAGIWSAAMTFNNYTQIYTDPEDSSEADFLINVWSGSVPLHISTPEYGQVYQSPVSITGLCPQNVDFELYDISSTTPAYIYYFDLTCSNNAFATTVSLSYDVPWWKLTGTTTSGLLHSVVFGLSTSSDYGILDLYKNTYDVLGREFPTPFDEFAEADLGYWAFLWKYAQSVAQNTRPYSYIPEIVASFWSAIDDATSTDWVASIEMSTSNGTVTIPGIRSNLFDYVDDDYATNIRTFSTVIIYAGFIVSVWALRHKII